jgi:hypothetical protein
MVCNYCPAGTNGIGEDLEDDEPITAEEIKAEFEKISELDNIWAGAIPMTVDEEINIRSEKGGTRLGCYISRCMN